MRVIALASPEFFPRQFARLFLSGGRAALVSTGAVLLSNSVLAAPSLQASPSDSEIRIILHERVAVEKQSPGIVVGVIDESGSRIVSEGMFDRSNRQAMNGDTVFEIGSITKVFSGLLLADMVERKELSLDSPVAGLLPRSVRVPSRNGRQITLLDLATHRSGLPRLPGNMSPKDVTNPYADYTVAQLYDFLSGYTLPRDIGSSYEYSNLGVGLLGHVLALKAGTNYESLLLERVCGPLGMSDTRITLTPAMKARFAPGHTAGGEIAANWDIPTLAGAGALRSTAKDLLKFLSANLGLLPTPLTSAMELERKSRASAGSPTMDIGLCWHISKAFGAGLVWHNGGTGGYHSFTGFDPGHNRGVVVLANTANSIDDIGFHLLDSRHALARFPPPKERIAITLLPQTLRRYVGQYELAPGVLFDLRLENSRLMAKLASQPYLEIYPESETNFFYKAVDAQLTFGFDQRGQVTQLTLHQNGRDQLAKKIK